MHRLGFWWHSIDRMAFCDRANRGFLKLGYFKSSKSWMSFVVLKPMVTIFQPSVIQVPHIVHQLRPRRQFWRGPEGQRTKLVGFEFCLESPKANQFVHLYFSTGGFLCDFVCWESHKHLVIKSRGFLGVIHCPSGRSDQAQREKNNPTVDIYPDIYILIINDHIYIHKHC